MMGAGFAGNRDAAGFGFAEETHAACGTEVLAMDAGAGEFSEENVARDDGFFAGGGPAAEAKDSAVVAFVDDAVTDERVVLAVIENGEVEHAGVFASAAHDFVA